MKDRMVELQAAAFAREQEIAQELRQAIRERDEWKTRAQQAQSELDHLRTQHAQMRERLEACMERMKAEQRAARARSKAARKADAAADHTGDVNDPIRYMPPLAEPRTN